MVQALGDAVDEGPIGAVAAHDLGGMANSRARPARPAPSSMRAMWARVDHRKTPRLMVSGLFDRSPPPQD